MASPPRWSTSVWRAAGLTAMRALSFSSAVSMMSDIAAIARDRVHLLGRVSEEDKARMYRSVDVFVAPNTGGESFGIVLVEAMAAGATVLASDIPAFRRVLDDGAHGALFTSEDADDLAERLGALLDDPDRRAALDAAAAVAVRRYDWSSVAGRILRVYETVVAAGVR